MIVDTSAIIALVADEDDVGVYARAIAAAAVPRLSAASYLECGIVRDARRDPVISTRFDDLVDSAGFVIEPVTEHQARLARQAYRDFGKGSGHPAGLNFGDCFAYALSRVAGEPVLFTGGDFAKTDVAAVELP